MELMTGAMGTLLPKLSELLKEEYGLQKSVREKIRSLSRELEAAHAVLRKIGDVPPEQLDDPVRLWARDVREASYDMEDIVDTFLVHVGDDDDDLEAAETHMLRRLRKKVGALFKKSKARRKISILIQDITDKLDQVAARRSRYTVNNMVAPITIIDPRIMNLYKRPRELVGIDGPKDELISKLFLGVGGEGDDIDAGVLDDTADKKMRIISVVGFGGLGKTTLAKAVYDQLKLHFECSAFVPVGCNPSVKKVFRDILIGLDKNKHSRNSNLMMLDEKQLMDELKEFIQEKRCFIVIDDIWDKETWILIRCALQYSDCESRVVITTRISEVATLAGDETYKMQPLSREDSEKLLYARITDGDGKYYFDSPSAEACEKILKKCGGVPLAIITIASLLISKPKEEWSEVYNSIGFGHGGNNGDVGNTRRILSFSYYDLSSPLKPCLLYLSAFSEDQVIEKNSLIWKWIAEGFIHEDEATGVGLFELGERYFNELINRNMIQPVETNEEGFVYGCRVHDMVFDLVHSLSSKENFVTVLDADGRQRLPAPGAGSVARRLALNLKPRTIQEHYNSCQLTANIAVDKVRCLIASQCDFGSSCPRIPIIRVLDMDSCDVGKKGSGGFLDHLGNFRHLRYLRLASRSIKELPREVKHLKFLKTLDLSECEIEELPEEVGLLTQLVCLRAGYHTRVPAGLIGRLTSLQDLSISPAAAGDHDVVMRFVEELGMLRELRVLQTYVDVTDEIMRGALLESLGNLHNIRIMRIEGSLFQDQDRTGYAAGAGAGLVSCRHLQYLCLRCFVFSGLPSWIKPSLAPYLSYLEVNVLAVKEQDLETLARLPELRGLKLNSLQAEPVSIKIIRTGGVYFRKLRALRIWGSPIRFDFDLRGCECSSSSIMPNLESLGFQVHVRLLLKLKEEALLSFDRLLSFKNLGETSLQRVTAQVNCAEATYSEVEDVEAELAAMAAVHPKRPTLRVWRLGQKDMRSLYQVKRTGRVCPVMGGEICVYRRVQP